MPPLLAMCPPLGILLAHGSTPPQPTGLMVLLSPVANPSLWFGGTHRPSLMVPRGLL